MSVLVPDFKVYNYIQAGIEKIASNSIINDFYSYSIQHHFQNCPDTPKEIKNVILSWLNLNQWSWDKKYLKEDETPTDLTEFYSSPLMSFNVSSVQLLKYLQCIDYNIEIKPEDGYHKTRLRLLKDCINDLQRSIISNLPEYKEAQWCEPLPIIKPPINVIKSLTSRSNRKQLHLDKAAKTNGRNARRGSSAGYY
jgi:hypothetical protein